MNTLENYLHFLLMGHKKIVIDKDNVKLIICHQSKDS